MITKKTYYVYGSEHPKYKSLLHFCDDEGIVLCKRKMKWGEVTGVVENIEENNLKISGFGNSKNFPSYIYNYKDITCKVCIKKLLKKRGGEMKEFLNTKPFKYQARYGTEFTCKRCDFGDTVFYENSPKKLSHQLSDVAEMTSYHAMNIWENLNGFSGYDCIVFEKKIKNKEAN